MEGSMSKRQEILRFLEKGTLLFDGATGTYAKTLPGFPEGPVELACLTAPQMVAGIHEAYLRAGSRLIKTNTFAAHPGLAVRDEVQQRAVIAGAYAIAENACAPYHALVFADIGPAPSPEEAERAYIRAADCFLDAGAECFLFETMTCAAGLIQAAKHIRKRCEQAFIAVSFAADPDGFTRSGEHVLSLIEEMSACEQIDAVGLNCICGAYHMKRLLGQIGKRNKPLLAMPNAGYPHLVDGRMYYDSDPYYFAQQVAACSSLGARIVGGCCGTTPAHIAQLARELTQMHQPQLTAQEESESRAADCQSEILKKLKAGKKPILVELDPPRNAATEGFIEGALSLVKSGVDAITIADCPIGRARMDSSILSCKLKREYGIETIPHMTCRDRNVNATKALLLGLAMEGVHNVLVVTGDPVPTSDRGSVKSVFQFHSRVLARFVQSLCQSGETSPFFLCGALNVNAANFDAELEKAKQKEEAGVQAFLTQPVLSEQAAENLHHARKALRGYLFGGLFPIVSHKNALFMDSEVAGVSLDERILRACEGLDRAQGETLAQRLCLDAARRIAPDVDGYYIMTPFQRIELVQRIVKSIRE